MSAPPNAPEPGRGNDSVIAPEPGRASAPPNAPEPGRRSLWITLAVFGSLAVLVSGASLVAGSLPKPAPAGSPAPATQDAPDPRVLAYLGPLAEGRPFGASRITRTGRLERGGIMLDLAGENGAPLTVDLRALSPSAPPGIAATKRVAIYLRTGRSGAPTTAEAQRACADLAAALTDREAQGHDPPPLEPLPPRP